MSCCTCCGRRFPAPEADVLAYWCDDCLVRATQGRAPEQVEGDWRCAVVAAVLLAVLGLALGLLGVMGVGR